MIDKRYYNLMLEKNRCFTFRKDDGKLGCIITYYIGNDIDLDRFIHSDPWEVVEDKEEGKICYIAQLLTDKEKINPKYSYRAWHSFKEYIIKEYPSVNYIYWVRWNKETKNRKCFIKFIKEERNERV